MPQFSLITLNCFGVPTPSTRARLLALAADLNRRAVDAVCLQEVQLHAYRRLLSRVCTAYPAHIYQPFVHAPKGGLLMLSARPPGESGFTLYQERGLWYTPALADWILHKGVLRAALDCDGVPVIVLNTHLTANYSGDWGRANAFARHEAEQLRELAGIVNTLPTDALVLVCGDFNVPRGSWLIDEFLALSRMTDPLAGDTRPTFRPPPPMPARYAAPIDFTLIRAPRHLLNFRADAALIYQEKTALPGGQTAYLSDHCGISLALRWD